MNYLSTFDKKKVKQKMKKLAETKAGYLSTVIGANSTVLATYETILEANSILAQKMKEESQSKSQGLMTFINSVTNVSKAIDSVTKVVKDLSDLFAEKESAQRVVIPKMKVLLSQLEKKARESVQALKKLN